MNVVFLSTEVRGSYHDFFLPTLSSLGCFRRFFNALLNTSASICRLLDIVKNTMFPITFVFISKLSC